MMGRNSGLLFQPGRQRVPRSSLCCCPLLVLNSPLGSGVELATALCMKKQRLVDHCSPTTATVRSWGG